VHRRPAINHSNPIRGKVVGHGDCRYLALSGEHVLLLPLLINISTPIKSRHSIIQDPIKPHRQHRLPTIMLYARAKVQSRGTVIGVVRDVAGFDCGFGFGFGGFDYCFMDLEFVGVEDDFGVQSAQLLKTTKVSTSFTNDSIGGRGSWGLRDSYVIVTSPEKVNLSKSKL